MKVLHVGKFPPEYCGGVENAFFGLSRRLAGRCDLDVVCSSLGRDGGVEPMEGFSCRRLPTWFTVFSTPFTPALVAFLWRARDYDVIHLSFQNPMACLAYMIARPPGKLVIWWHHDVVRQRFLGLLIRPLLEAVLRRADAVVATSRAYASSSPLLRRFAAKVRVVPLGIDLEPWSRPEHVAEGAAIRREVGAPLVVFVGRLVYYKGLRYLLEAMVRLDARLLVVGRGPLERELRALSERLGVAARLRWIDAPRGRSVAPYIHAADALVLPSSHRTEAFGLVIVEAMACGKPVVATELGTGTSEICRDGTTGFVVPPADPEALARALGKILADPAAARAMGEAGRRDAQAFSEQAMADGFLALYRSLTGDRDAARA